MRIQVKPANAAACKIAVVRFVCRTPLPNSWSRGIQFPPRRNTFRPLIATCHAVALGGMGGLVLACQSPQPHGGLHVLFLQAVRVARRNDLDVLRQELPQHEAVAHNFLE